MKTKALSKVDILTLNGSAVAISHPGVILDKIISNLPHAQVEIKELFQNLVLADPTFHLSSAIDMMIGAEFFGKIITGNRLTFREGLPVAMNSRFALSSLVLLYRRHHLILLTLDPLIFWQLPMWILHCLLQLFWKIEEPPIKITQLTPEEDYCGNHFGKEHSRYASGRFIIRLPFIERRPPLGNSYDDAKRRAWLITCSLVTWSVSLIFQKILLTSFTTSCYN